MLYRTLIALLLCCPTSDILADWATDAPDKYRPASETTPLLSLQSVDSGWEPANHSTLFLDDCDPSNTSRSQSSEDLSLVSPSTHPSSASANGDSERKTPLRFTIADWFSPEYHGLENTRGNTVAVRAYIPWQIGSVEQLSRLSLPFVTASAGHSSDGFISDTSRGPGGFGNLEIYNVTLLETRFGELSLGPVMSFPTGAKSGVGSGQWTLGPAIGFSSREGSLKWGFFSQGYFSFAGEPDGIDVRKTKIQPIFNIALPRGWEVGVSEMNFTYGWATHRFTNLPLGIEVGRAFEICGQHLKISEQAEYNFATAQGSSAWTFRFTLEYVMP